MSAATGDTTAPRVAIVGGGLAGLAAAVALGTRGLNVELFEARRRLGGRASSFVDPQTGEQVDHCQHVSLGCCTNLADFLQRTGTADLVRRDRELQFFTRDGRSSLLRGNRWPAPLHLAPAFLRLHFLSLRERLAIARALVQLARTPPARLASTTVAGWLAAHGQSPRAIERFWAVVLVSALGESVERASMLHAQKVFVDGFMANRDGYVMYVPQAPLGELYGERLLTWFAANHVNVRLGVAVESIEPSGDQFRIQYAEGDCLSDAVIVAVPWSRVAEVFAPDLCAKLPAVTSAQQIEAAPITGVHLWFDRPITELKHAVLVDMLSQWLFNRASPDSAESTPGEHYYQVVISASRGLAGRDRAEVVAEICAELRDVFPAAREAKLLRWRMVTDPNAVFSVRPGVEHLRPAQATSIARLALAGDWTRTGWPATMEGAVRSGYQAAEAVLESLGHADRVLVADLPREGLAKWMIRNDER